MQFKTTEYSTNSRKKDIRGPEMRWHSPTMQPMPDDMALLARQYDRYTGPKDPERIVSLWTMLEFQSESLLAAMAFLGGAASECRVLANVNSNGPQVSSYQPLPVKAQTLVAVQQLQKVAEQYDMKTAINIGARTFKILSDVMAPDCAYSFQDLSKIQTNLEMLLTCFISEASSMKFYAMAVGSESYHASADEVIGPKIVDAFPAAEFDLTEAGRCLSFELWTATVMHCMRALEEGLKALAHEVSIEPSGNWNKTLNDIESKLREVRQKTDGKEAEQWAAEAGTHLRFVKNAFRNQAMHNISIYDRHRSKDIYRNTISFLAHLATHISDET